VRGVPRPGFTPPRSRSTVWLPSPRLPPPPPPAQKFEEIYLKECAKSRPAPEAKFNYAWALIRSPSRPDMRKGVIMMSGLLEDRFSDRDCLYYMALGHYRLDDVVVRGLLLSERPVLCGVRLLRRRLLLGVVAVGGARVAPTAQVGGFGCRGYLPQTTACSERVACECGGRLCVGVVAAVAGLSRGDVFWGSLPWVRCSLPRESVLLT